MILELFAILLGASLFMIALGHYLDADILKIFGFFLWFMLGIIFISDGIDYKSGDVIVTEGDTTTVTPTYVDYSNWQISAFLTIVGAMGMTFVLVGRRTKSITED